MRLNGIWVGVAALALAACGGASGGADAPDVETPPVIEEASEPSLLGEWVASDDALSTLTVSDATLSFGYDGESDGEEPYTIEQGCPTAPEAPFEDDTIVTRSEEGDTFCYAIDTLEADRLVLIYLPRGNVLEYVRQRGQYLVE